MCTVRRLPGTGETAVRPINSRPGYFDAHGLVMPDNGIRFDEELNSWVVVYQGLRLLEDERGKRTEAGYGILLLWGANPEQILYRSMLPVAVEELNGWKSAGREKTTLLLKEFRKWIPAATISDITYLNAYLAENIPFPSQMAQWQKQKAHLA
jgi:hypothetical protein